MNAVARPLNANVARKAKASMTPPNCERTAEAARTMRRSQPLESESSNAQARRPPSIAPMMAVWAERVMERTNASRNHPPLDDRDDVLQRRRAVVGLECADDHDRGRDEHEERDVDDEGDDRKVVTHAAHAEEPAPPDVGPAPSAASKRTGALRPRSPSAGSATRWRCPSWRPGTPGPQRSAPGSAERACRRPAPGWRGPPGRWSRRR